ncbi:Fe-S cluster assembly sulfur transfer protein SufU [Legionella sp. W05-934-2]|jgi:nitrogen fixation NifU-like protein|uniref:Fe-S cluster assembly sulfur transfer protein SufU n=1 Tax=Legionella sp. W05-934-2 TaxID=1198649 RepID=UPI0034635811
MSFDLRELYQEIIIDHNRNPRNHHDMTSHTHHAEGFNPLCGDKLSLYLQVCDNTIQDISFVGCGCAISQASASLMTEALKGKTVDEAKDLFQRFHHMLTEDDDVSTTGLDKLTVLSGVRMFPARVKCATLAWHTLDAALKQAIETASTE